MAQVVIASNRLPISVKKLNGKLIYEPSVGGLATGLSSYAKDKNSLWIGWPGIANDEITDDEREQIVTELTKHNCSPVFLSQRQLDDYYNGYSNTVLWPLFHKLRPQDRPGKKRDKWYKTYREVNKLFAENIEVSASKGAQVWVHDYQLLLVPGILRQAELDANIGFFHHIPFPDAKKFMTLPRYKTILKGLLGADVIGFHTPEYVDNFLDTCTKAGLGEVNEKGLLTGDRQVQVSDFPMGIDYDKYSAQDNSAETKLAVKKYQKKYRHKKLIVAVDRLDPSKGLLERVSAYGLFLKQHRRFHGKVVFIMVASPSRTDVPAYKRLSEQLAIEVKKINKRYGTSKWKPIDYIDRTVPFEEVTALFQIADVAFIAPLRDGMNLVAKEFVAGARKNSVLILSETAGAAKELKDALIVNPLQPETVVQALYESLTMSRSDIRARLKRMKKYLEYNTVHKWAKDFVGVLQRPASNVRSLNRNYMKDIADDFSKSKKRLILLDYDGTLVPFCDHYMDAKPPAELLKLLTKLGKDKSTDVVLISGRSSENMDQWFGKLPINMVAEHGASTKRSGKKSWHDNNKLDDSWKRILQPILEKYAAQTPGAKVEIKPHSLVWHYRNVSPYHAQKSMVIIKRVLRKFLSERNLRIMAGNKVLEIKSSDINKGKAAEAWLENKYDFALSVGDDVTDESMFRVMPKGGYSIKVGRGRTVAEYRTADSRGVIKLLKQFK